MGKNGEGLKKCFSKVGDAKLKEGFLVGPQIRKLTRNNEFDVILAKKYLAPWIWLIQVFLGNHKSEKNIKQWYAEIL